jgi:glycosyltransferase involved in cell wall biosynthesis
MSPLDTWICCQIGAREHYAIARALHSAGRLHSLVTDIWCRPSRYSLGKLNRRVAERFHPELEDARVYFSNPSAIAFELRQKLSQQSAWSAVMSRNACFQDVSLRYLKAVHKQFPSRRFVVFAYSYAALKIFQFAKSVGWLTVLGQIDPGPAGEKLVAELHRKSTLVKAPSWVPVPDEYWDNWRTECALADRIVVNSDWTSKSIAAEASTRGKISIVPLVFEPASPSLKFSRECPDNFTFERPLRLLFLGLAALRKGIEVVIQAADRLLGSPVEIWVVGRIQIPRTAAHSHHSVLRWFGSVPRSAVDDYYRGADAFLFPTFSDGFGITQLEAQAWKLPLIVSRFCGDVVEEEVNGVLLEPLSSDVLVATIRDLLTHPAKLRQMVGKAVLKPEHRMSGLADRLTSAITEDSVRF